MDSTFIDLKSIGVILLASGYSRRMGMNKCLLPVGNEGMPCIRQVVQQLSQCKVGKILVIYQDEGTVKALEGMAVDCLFNSRAAEGQSAAIKLGISQTWPDGVKAWAFVMADQPLLVATDYMKLFKEFLSCEVNIAVPCVADECFSPAVFDIGWKDQLLALEGDRGGKKLFEHPEAKVGRIIFEDSRIFMDMDTIEDYQRVCGYLKNLDRWGD